MKAAFRVDASLQMGTGHLMRCLALAQALRARGVQVRFVCRAHTGNLIAMLQQRALPVAVLPAPATHPGASGEGYAGWLGLTQAEDALQTIEVLADQRPDWLVVDHYALDADWETQVRPHVGQLMVIDDLANRRHDCELLLDQNYARHGEQRYAGLVPAACRQMTGPRYALLAPEYAAHRRSLRERDGRVGHVLVFFGGSDLDNMTATALEAMSCPELAHLEVDVVVGANNLHREALVQQAQRRPRTRIHGPRPHLADLMAQADLAIGAGGATTWERMCLGLPTVVVSIAQNQRPACQALAQAGLIHYAGPSAEVSAGQLRQQLRVLSRGGAGLAEMARRNQAEVDGLGAARLAEALHPTAVSDLRLRTACLQDMLAYYNWANDPVTRRNAIDTSPIAWDVHHAWFTAKLRDAATRLFVLEAAGLPVGQIRFDKDGDRFRISYSLDPIVRGRGWGRRLVALGTDLMEKCGAVRMWAQVKIGNEASTAIFLRLGFTQAEGTPQAGLRSFYRDGAPARERMEKS